MRRQKIDKETNPSVAGLESWKNKERLLLLLATSNSHGAQFRKEAERMKAQMGVYIERLQSEGASIKYGLSTGKFRYRPSN